MAKEKKHGITFDSGWEVQYWEKLTKDGVEFKYHPNKFKVDKINYEPDFLNYEGNGIVKLIEIKSGYNPYSQAKDNMLHSGLKSLVKYEQEYLIDYVQEYFSKHDIIRVEYQKIKYLTKHGFVDFSFKSPTLKDAWKLKAINFEKELKEAKKKLKDYERWVDYTNKDKLTKSQRDWKNDFEIKVGIN